MSRHELRERNDQLVSDWDATPPGRRFHLMGRYGFRSMRCVYSQVWLVKKRRRLAEAQSNTSGG